MANKSYINTMMLDIVPKPKRYTRKVRDIKVQEINNEGYSKEIASGTDETGFGENDKNKALWLKNLHQYLFGPDSMNPDMKNMPGNPFSSLPHFGSKEYKLLKKAIFETMREKVRNALDRAKKEGIIDKNQDIFDVQIDIPGVGLVTYEELSEELAEKALDIINKLIAEKSKSKSNNINNESNLGSNITSENATQDSTLNDLNKAIDALEQVSASYNVSTKIGKKDKFPPSGETDVKHIKRKLVEQLSKDEEEEVEFYKTQYEPNLESKPYLQDGNANENPEQAFAGTPMWNSVYMWMS